MIKSKLTYDKSRPLLTSSIKNGSTTSAKASTIRFEDFTDFQTEYLAEIKDGYKELVGSTNSHNNGMRSDSKKIKNDIMKIISKRIELAINFNVTDENSASKFRASLYGLGGMAESHTDAYGVEKQLTFDKRFTSLYETGDLVATLLLWLNRSQGGGGTFFSSSIKRQMFSPSKGSALFWINLKASGAETNYQTHGGCPVSKGSKFVIARWIFHYNQWKIIPCSRQKNAEILIPKISQCM